jgi:hypothetical protein
MTRPVTSFLICSICFQPIRLETTKTDEHGKPMHEDCYVSQVTARKSPSQGQRKVS